MLTVPRLLALAALTAALLERWRIVALPLWFLAVALIPSLWLAGRRLGTVRLSLPMALFCVFVPLSLAWNEDPGYSYRGVLTFCAFVLIALWLVVSETPSSALGLLAAAAAVTLVASVVVVLLMPDLFPPEVDNPDAFRGIFTHKNWLGLAVGYLILAVIHLKPRHRALRWLPIGAGVPLLIAAKSVGAGIALVITLVAVGGLAWLRRWLSPNMQRAAQVAAIGGGVVLLFTGFQWVYGLAVDLGKGRSIDRRFELWTVAFQHALERPLFGWGWRGSLSESRGVGAAITRDMGGFQTTSTHNGYVDIFLQAGIVGSVLLAILVVRSIWPPRRDPSLRGWSALVLFSALVTVTDSFLAGHVPILIVLTAYLFAHNPHLWQESAESPDEPTGHADQVHAVTADRRRHSGRDEPPRGDPGDGD